MNKLTMGSLFDGIGGFVNAGNQVGINTLWSSEIDPCCEAVTKHHFPEVKQLGDITKIKGAEVPPVDIICGGSPCQDLSVAGKRAGLAGERSGLYMEQIRIIREMRVATSNTYPRYMVWENVPGALSSNKGDDFRAVLEEAARCAENGVSIPQPKKWGTVGNIVGNGWSIAWRILDAQHWGVPQRRRRIFLVTDFGSERAGEILFKPEGLRWNSAESGEAREGTAVDVEGSVGGSVYNESGQGYWMPDFGCLRAEGENRPTRPGHCVVQEVKCLNPSMPQSSRIYDATGIYPALSANENGGQNRQAVIYEPKSAFEENWAESKVKNALRAESSKSSHAVVEKTEAFNESGIGYWMPGVGCLRVSGDRPGSPNQVICEDIGIFMAGQGAKARTIGYSEDSAPTLKSTNSGGNTVPSVVYGVDCRNVTIDEELTHTLQAKPGGGYSLNCTPLVMATGQENAEITHNLSTTLLGESHEQPICVHPRVCGTIAASGAGTNRPAGQGNETDLCIVTKARKHRKYIIRRLTPLECERLQGFPDGWTDITYKNKPMSDSARYRMCGNSVAIPCVVRVLGGIADIHKQNV